MIDIKMIAKAKASGSEGTGTTTSGGGMIDGVAEEAKHAVKADLAVSAEYAEKSGYATKAAWAGGADTAGKATNAEHATKADEAEHAAKADTATEAEHAAKADYAEVANDLTEDSPVNDRFLSALEDDTAKGRITFEKEAALKDGAVFGEYTSSLTAGKGAGIDAQGNAEMESLRVRSYFECLELLVNRLSAIEGDQLLTESDTIESVDDLGDGCYGLHLKSKWDGYFTAQAENNVLKGIINTLAEGSGTYYTAWFRVNSVNTATNYIEVTQYADDEVPSGKNYPPCEMMKIARWGNQTDTKRQDCLYLSSTEGRIVKLKGVTKPILENHNYGAAFGSLPDFVKSIKDDEGNKLPLREGMDYMYIPGIVTMDTVRLNRWTLKPIAETVDCGEWDAQGTYHNESLNETTGRYETSEVWHKGVKWRCMKDGTKQEPTKSSTDWVAVGGYPDLSGIYEMDIDTGGDTLIGRGEEKNITCSIINGLHEDVTGDVTAWTVARDSGNEAADTAWGYDHKAFAGTLAITLDDLQSAEKVTFMFMATMADEEKVVGCLVV